MERSEITPRNQGRNSWRVGHFCHRTSPARTISLPAQDISPAVKAKIWNRALAHTPNPNRPTMRSPDPYPYPNRLTGRGFFWKLALTHTPNINRPTTWGSDRNPNRPTRWGIFWKVALTCIPDRNRSTAIKIIRSFHIVDWRMVVVEGAYTMWKGREMSGGVCPGGNVRIPLKNKFTPVHRRLIFWRLSTSLQ